MTNNTKSQFRFNPKTKSGLDKLGRIPLSANFHMREFLYSETAIAHGIWNVPDDVEAAVKAGSQLCELLLEPLQESFGRIHIRSGFRSREVNAAGIGQQCAADNDGAHVWDFPSKKHGIGAMACISIPSVSKKILSGEVEYPAIAWWILDNLPHWSVIEFFSTPSNVSFANEVCFNLGWHERPMHSITSWRNGKSKLDDDIPTAVSRKKSWEKLVNVRQ